MEKEVQKYTKEMVVESNLFGGDRDIIMTILEEGKEYSRDEIQAEVEKFKTMPIKEKVNGGKE